MEEERASTSKAIVKEIADIVEITRNSYLIFGLHKLEEYASVISFVNDLLTSHQSFWKKKHAWTRRSRQS